MSAFDKYFAEPRYFSGWSWVISGKLSREDAAAAISEAMLESGDIDEPLCPESIDKDRVRYGFAPEYVEEMSGELCWYTGATGKGSMPVWVLK